MAQRWAFLRPWWRVLEKHKLAVVSQRCGFREELYGLSVSVYPRDTSDEDNTPILLLRDALELVLLLAVIDRDDFIEVVHSYACEERVDAPMDAEYVLKTHREASLSCVDLQFGSIKPGTGVVAVFLTPQAILHRDPAFQEARRQMIAQISPRETDKHAACENLKISIRVATSVRRPPQELMRLVENADMLTKKHGVAYPFVAAPFELDVSPSTFTEETVAEINAWHERGARLPFDRVRITSQNWASTELFGHALLAVLRPHASATAASSPTIFDTVTIDSTPDPDCLVQIFSAFRHTRLVRVLKLSRCWDASQSEEERRFSLRWVFFALFSSWSTHSIKEVDLTGIRFSEDEIEGILELLRCENPLPLLFEDEHERQWIDFGDSTSIGRVSGSRRQVLLVKGSRLKLYPSTVKASSGAHSSVEISQDVWIDVAKEVTRGSQDWLVLVPAFGLCRLRRADVLNERAVREQSTGSVGSRAIKSLLLNAPLSFNDEGRGIFPLLRWLGPQLEALTLEKVWSGHFLVDLLASCPSLKRLHLPSADPCILPQLEQAYESGECKVSSLDLRHLRGQEHTQEATHFFEALSDPTRRIAQTVRELLYSDEASPFHTRMNIAEMRTMLENNTTLEYFERTSRVMFSRDYVALCREFSGVSISVTPMASRSQLAFLSAISGNMTVIPTVIELDDVAIAHIFDLAAERVYRRVQVGAYPPYE